MYVHTQDTKEVVLPVLGRRTVVEVKSEPGHYLWLDLMGWHDCTRGEDAIIRSHEVMRQNDAVYPGHPITVALIITQVFPNFEGANVNALGSSAVPGAGGNVHQALDLLRAAKEGQPLDKVFAEADTYWAECDGQAKGGHTSDKERHNHYVARWMEGQEQADKVKDELRARLATWLLVVPGR